jgi:hypothetical protein
MEIAISPAIAAGRPEPAISEPISPELVLVDPELRRALQAEALERAPLRLVTPEPEPSWWPREAERSPVAPAELPSQAQRTVPTPVPLARPEGEPPRAHHPLARAGRYLVHAILPISLVLNAILITLAVSDATVSPAPTAAGPSLNRTAPDSNGQTPLPAAQPKRRSTQTRAAVTERKPTAPRLGARDPRLERKLLNLIVQAPAGRLPRELINSKTGLAKNNLHAVCRREAGRGSFLCLIRPSRHKPGEGLYARYRVKRKGKGGTFTWYHYRSG